MRSQITFIEPHLKDLGGAFYVRRSLPAPQLQAVGPFLFFDHFGPVPETPGRAHDVRPHPHIGLATVTYLFEGAMVHRDSLGHEQRIEPGAINLMTAGRGIVHSERKPPDLLDGHHTVHGLQLWLALPVAQEACAPAFEHTAFAAIPMVKLDEHSHVRVLMGEAFGVRSPVTTFAPTVYLDIALGAGAVLTLPPDDFERALYSVDQAIALDGEPVPAHVMCVLPPGAAVQVSAPEAARLVLIGGAPLDGGRRHIWWNFVASSPARIDQAKADWAAQRMGQVPGEHEWIPLPKS